MNNSTHTQYSLRAAQEDRSMNSDEQRADRAERAERIARRDGKCDRLHCGDPIGPCDTCPNR